MSQKVRIDGVKHTGASVFLGVDHCGNPCWTRNAERIMVWLCDGWRTRFNQRREQRPRNTPVKDEGPEVIAGEVKKMIVKLTEFFNLDTYQETDITTEK